jgi:sulfite exporter TauE/SafE
MTTLELAAAFTAGLAASGHCLAMCGSVTCTLDAACAPGTRARTHSLFLLGRVSGYALAGLAAGTLGGALRTVAPSNAQWGIRAAVAVLGVLVGLQTAGVWRVFSSAEPAFQRVFAKVSPKAKELLRSPSASASLTLGLLWSLVPCGMVYAALALAATSGSAPSGALTMLAFGLGTAPALLSLAYLSARLRGVQNARWVSRARIVLGLAVALMSVVEGARALDRMGWFGNGARVVWDQSDHCSASSNGR